MALSIRFWLIALLLLTAALGARGLNADALWYDEYWSLYYAGGALLDLDKPWKVIHRTQDYLLAPTEIYERVGDVPNVVFPSSAVVEGDKIRLYYGCADTCISMAEAKVSDVIQFIKTHSFPN